MTKPKTPAAPPEFTLKALIICDEIEFADATGVLLRRVGRHKNLQANWEVKCWLVSAENENAMAEIAFAESLNAHLIVLPSWLAHCFPRSLRHWLERWASSRRIEQAALGIVNLDGIAAFSEPCPEFNKFISRHKLHFVGAELSIADNSRNLAVSIAPEPVPRFLALPRLASSFAS